MIEGRWDHFIKCVVRHHEVGRRNVSMGLTTGAWGRLAGFPASLRGPHECILWMLSCIHDTVRIKKGTRRSIEHERGRIWWMEGADKVGRQQGGVGVQPSAKPTNTSLSRPVSSASLAQTSDAFICINPRPPSTDPGPSSFLTRSIHLESPGKKQPATMTKYIYITHLGYNYPRPFSLLKQSPTSLPPLSGMHPKPRASNPLPGRC